MQCLQAKQASYLKRILWAKHQNKKIIVIKPSIDNRYSNEKIITHNDLSHECYAMTDWQTTLKKFTFEKSIKLIWFFWMKSNLWIQMIQLRT